MSPEPTGAEIVTPVTQPAVGAEKVVPTEEPKKDGDETVRLDMPKISFKDWIALCTPILLGFEIQKQKKLNELMARGVPAFFL